MLDRLLARVVGPGWSNALAAKLLALTMPGVPDVYQGSELWEQSLVDPDNRRFVDFDREARLGGSRGDDARRLTAPPTTGCRQAAGDPGGADLRRDQPELFTSYAGVGGDRRGSRTTCWPSTAAARSPW